MTDSAFIFDHRYRAHQWRFQIAAHPKGGKVLSVWPWFQDSAGEWRPGSARYGGGFQMPLERLGELAEALTAAAAQHAPDGP
jgi:hypothetical protein